MLQDGFRRGTHRSTNGLADPIVTVVRVVVVSVSRHRYYRVKHTVVDFEPRGLFLDDDDLAVGFTCPCTS